MRTVLRPHRKLARARNNYNQRLLMVDNFNCPTGLPDGFYWNGTDTYSTIDLGANGGFETAGGGGADIWGSWTEVAGDGAIADEGSLVHSGSHAAKLTGGASANTDVKQNVTVIPGLMYSVSFWTRGDGSAAGRYSVWNVTSGGYIVGATTTGISGTNYTQITFTFTAPVACVSAQILLSCPPSNGGIAYFDDVTVYPTQGLISVSGGNLVFAGGKATPMLNNPWLPGSKYHARQIGLTVEWQFRVTSGNGWIVGFADSDGNQFGPGALAAWYGGFQPTINGVAWGPVLPITPALSTSYVLKVVCKAVGYLWYLSRDGGIAYPLFWHNDADATALLRSSIMSYDAALTASFCKVYYGYAKPAVLSASPGAPALVAGNELLTDPGVEAWDSATDLTSYTEYLAGTSTINREGTIKHGGTYAARLDVDGSNSAPQIVQALNQSVGQWVVVNYWAYSSASGKTLRSGTYGTGLVSGPARDPGSVWTQYAEAYRIVNIDNRIQFTRVSAASASLYFDDVSAKPLPFDQTGVLEYIEDAGVKLGIAKANITVAAGYHAGFVVCADSATAPVYSVMAYYDRTAGKAYLLKQANNVWTEMVASTVAYAAGAELRLVCVDDKWGLYYNGALQGAIQTIDVSANYGNHVHSFQTGTSDTVASLTVDA